MVALTAIAGATLLTGGAAALTGLHVGFPTAVSLLVGAPSEAAAITYTFAATAPAGALYGLGSTAATGATTMTCIGSAGVSCAASVSSGGAVTTLALGSDNYRKGMDCAGLLLVGTSNNQNGNEITYDCWKPVIHDKSREPSKGKLLNEIINHPNILKTTVTTGDHPDLPNIEIENIWGEVFEIEYILLHTTGNIVCHATQI